MKHVTSWRGQFPRHCARAQSLFFFEEIFLKRAVANAVSSLTGRGLNFRPHTPETNPLRLYQMVGFV